MNNIVEINGVKVEFSQNKDSVFCTSLDIAKVFEKEHKNVLRDIENILENLRELGVLNGQLNFEPSSKRRKNGVFDKESKIYNLTRDGFSLLAMGFTGTKALQWKLSFLEAFNMLEQFYTQENTNTKSSDYLVELLDIKSKKLDEAEKEIVRLKQDNLDDLYVELLYKVKQVANKHFKGNRTKLLETIFTSICIEFCIPYTEYNADVLKSNVKYLQYGIHLCDGYSRLERHM